MEVACLAEKRKDVDVNAVRVVPVRVHVLLDVAATVLMGDGHFQSFVVINNHQQQWYRATRILFGQWWLTYL